MTFLTSAQFKASYFALGLLLIYGSCKKDQHTVATSKIIKFTSTIQNEIKTRAKGSSWEINDTIGIFMTSDNQQEFDAYNRKYLTANGDGNFSALAGQEITQPINGKAASFVAYYPYQNIEQGNYHIDLKKQTSPSSIDLMYSDNVQNFDQFEETSPNLQFSHQLAAVQITIKAGSGITTVNKVEATLENYVTEADFNLRTGTMSTARSAGNISAKITPNGTTQIASMLLLPGTYAAGKNIRFALQDGSSYSFTFPADTKFEKGLKYNYNVVLQATDNAEKFSLLVEANYETGSTDSGLPDLSLTGASAKDAEYIVSPGATGNYAIAHKVTLGDEGYFSSNHWRSEAATAQMFELGKYYNGDERRFEISILLKDWQPYTSDLSDNGDIIFQGKQSGGSFPAWYLMTKRNQIAFRIAQDQVQVSIVDDFRPYINKWIHYRIDAKMTNEPNGYYKVYCKLPGETNYQLKYQVNNYKTFNIDLTEGSSSGYLKWGLYRPGSSLSNSPPDVATRIIYHDDMRIYKLN